MLEPEFGRVQAGSVCKFFHNKHQLSLISRREIPGICREFVFNRLCYARRSIKAEDLVAANQMAKQMIEADEVIDMHMGDEDIAHAQ